MSTIKRKQSINSKLKALEEALALEESRSKSSEVGRKLPEWVFGAMQGSPIQINVLIDKWREIYRHLVLNLTISYSKNPMSFVLKTAVVGIVLMFFVSRVRRNRKSRDKR